MAPVELMEWVSVSESDFDAVGPVSDADTESVGDRVMVWEPVGPEREMDGVSDCDSVTVEDPVGPVLESERVKDAVGLSEKVSVAEAEALLLGVFFVNVRVA